MGGITLEMFAKANADMNKRLDRIASRVSNESHLVSFQGSITGVNGQVMCDSFAGPGGGYEWHIRRMSFGTSLNTIGSVTQQGTLLVGKGSVSLLATGQFILGTPTTFIEMTRTTVVPNALVFSHQEFVIRSQESLIVAWNSGVGTLIIDGDAVEVPTFGSPPAEE